jgi:hypothetical protein
MDAVAMFGLAAPGAHGPSRRGGDQMSKKIRTHAETNGLLLDEIQKQEAALAKSQKLSGKDEAVIRITSQRDRTKFIQRRLN